MGVADPHRSMITWAGSDTGKCSCDTSKRVQVAPCTVPPYSLGVGHKANSVDPIAIVESIHVDQTMLVYKLSSKHYIQVWISLSTPLQFQSEDTPLLDIC